MKERSELVVGIVEFLTAEQSKINQSMLERIRTAFTEVPLELKEFPRFVPERWHLEAIEQKLRGKVLFVSDAAAMGAPRRMLGCFAAIQSGINLGVFRTA